MFEFNEVVGARGRRRVGFPEGLHRTQQALLRDQEHLREKNRVGK